MTDNDSHLELLKQQIEQAKIAGREQYAKRQEENRQLIKQRQQESIERRQQLDLQAQKIMSEIPAKVR
ncbi:MAG: hypothetical protein V1738_01315 [Patescibacteria group bacterium]